MSTESMAAAIAILRVAYPGEFGDEAVAFYARKLRDLEPAEVVGAVDRLTNRMRFRPTVADIRLEVAEARLGLPSVTEAWEIAIRGHLRAAPAPVREAALYVGGRWAITHSERPEVVRAQFREQYNRLREQALQEAAGATVRREMPVLEQRELTAGSDLPERLRPPAVLRREIDRMAGKPLAPPTEEEIRDAIAILRAGPLTDDPAEDSLYKAAELVHVHATEEGTHEATDATPA